MKKKTKVMLLIGIIGLVGAGGFLLGYQWMFHHVEPEIKTEIAEEVDTITDDILAEIEEAQEADATELDAEATQNEASELPPDSNQPVVSEKDKILSLYNTGFQKLQNEGNAIIDRLVEGIKADYAKLQEEGGSTVQLAQLAASYTNRANAYEEGIDSSVDTMLVSLQKDLKAAGVSEVETEACVAEYEKAYEEQKEARKNKILSKAKEFL